MADRLVARVLDDDGEPGRVLGSVTRGADGKITRRGLVAGDILDGVMEGHQLDQGTAFEKLMVNGWCNTRIVLELEG